MRRRVLKVNGCVSCISMEEAIRLTALGGVVRDYFKPRDGVEQPRVVVGEILCWWCREMHSPERVEACMALPRKVASANGSESSTSKSLDAGLLLQYSELWAFLTAETYPDGTRRQPGKISLSCESGLLGLLLTDCDNDQYAFLSGRNPTTLLEEAELRLSDGSLSFKPSKYSNSKKGKSR